MPIGLTLPLARSTSSLGYLATSTTELQATFYNIKALLLTNWGERPNQFYLGCNLRQFLFEPASEETFDRIRQRIHEQFSRWLPYVSIDSLNVSAAGGTDPKYSGSDFNTILVYVKFSLRGRSDLTDAVEVSISQDGG